MTDQVTQFNGGTCFEGEAVNIVRLAALISALQLELKGMRLSRHMSALAVAKRETGLATNQRQKHIDALQQKLDALKARTPYLDERTRHALAKEGQGDWNEDDAAGVRGFRPERT